MSLVSPDPLEFILYTYPDLFSQVTNAMDLLSGDQVGNASENSLLVNLRGVPDG